MPFFYKVKACKYYAFCCILFCSFFSTAIFAQAPVNDDCSAASVIDVGSAGFGLGIFNSDTIDISNATTQTGETFAAAIFVAGQDKKSIWYKFSISTIRSVRVTLSQPGVGIAAGNVGFAVYKTSACIPGGPDISTKLTPIATFGNSLHPCSDEGEYLIQVSSNLTANGPVFIQLELSDQTGALYDRPSGAYDFGVAANYGRHVDFNTECHSLEDSSERCNVLFNRNDYQKSAWFTFTTPAYFDYIAVLLSGATGGYFTGTYRTFGYNLYKGNVINTPIPSLVLVEGCDSLQSDGYAAGYKMYRCGALDTGTTYTIQLFFHRDFKEDLRLGIITGGSRPSRAPEPALASVPAPSAIGVLPAAPNGVVTTVTEVFGCNSRHANRACNPALADTGVVAGGIRYNLSTIMTFTLASATAINFYVGNTQCGPQPLTRIYKQAITSNCTDLDTSKIIAVMNGSSFRMDCMEPGDYTLQFLGRDEIQGPAYFYYYTSLYNYEQCLNANLGTSFRVDLSAFTRNGSNQFSLNVAGAFDTVNNVLNNMAPFVDGNSYQALADTLGCLNTLRPADTTCQPGNNKVMYRQFTIADSGIVTFGGLTYPLEYKLYDGDAGALAAAQSVFNYPDTISGLVARTLCWDHNTYCDIKRVCMVPGTYTLASFGSDAEVGVADRPTFKYNVVNTAHNSPFAAQDMGSIIDTLGPGGGTLNSDIDFWSCRNNADTINGFAPCTIGGMPATKAIYRQFYLKEPALIAIGDLYIPYCSNYAFGSKTLFRGKATDGLSGLTPLGGRWNCFQTASVPDGCATLDSGWYTVVSYGVGATYDNPLQQVNAGSVYSAYSGFQDQFYIRVTVACKGPKFNRPYKASIDTGTGLPYRVQWGNRVGHSNAYPHTDTSYILQEEYFNCTLDTPFAAHPVLSCAPAVNRVAYYVFQTTQDAYVQIDTKGYYGVLFNRDVRVDSNLFPSLVPIQPCLVSQGNIQICKMLPGTYTLVIFAGDANSCSSVQPTIYIDKIGYSRFDFAKNAYDFGLVPTDSVYHFGKTGDINPLDPLRQPSNDFFYCTTGAFSSDPTESACDPVNNKIYTAGTNVRLWDSTFLPSFASNSRRNLWYTFVVNRPGYVRIRVLNKTINKNYQYRYSVYKSNVNGTLPFTTVVSSGQVDSTVALGLTHIATNYSYAYCSNGSPELSFYRDPCNNSTDRYYIVVDNPNSYPYEVAGMKPNSQVEVAILIDSLTLVLPKFDHYYQASNLGTINNNVVTRGVVDNYSCATDDATDPTYAYRSSALKTLWYKFSTNLSGNVRYRIVVNGVIQYNIFQVQLFKQLIPGDSTSNGLIIQNINNSTEYDGGTNSYWANTCVSPGTYYVFLTGYTQLNEFVYPEVQILEQLGDYCSKPVATQLTGPGTASGSTLVNCHTIGTDYGEFGPQLTCPAGANTNQYKSSWFRLDISGTDVLDVTAFLVENTNASSTDIKYRLMTGNCGAMQEQSCVLDALTQNTYQCLEPGQSYFVQVFTPLLKNGQPVTGTIELRLSALKHTDTCAPLTSCLASANFTTAFDCTVDRTVKFVNFSTYGTDITYLWNFGYNNQTSTAVSPSFFYPATAADQNYTVKLIVTNVACGKRDSVTRVITVPGRPAVNFGADRTQCNGTPYTLNATSFAGATYQWQDGSTNPTFAAAAPGTNAYHVTVTYNGCIARDTINVLVNPVIKRPTQNFVLCAVTDSVLLNANRGGIETYQWNNGRTTSSIQVRNPGIYWVNIRYATCTIRDSFIVSSAVSVRPLGNDTTACLRSAAYLLNATINGAAGYSWQDGSTAATFSVTTAGLYWVDIRFAGCSIRDTVRITSFAAPAVQTSAASICQGEQYTLPWGGNVTAAGAYRDTLLNTAGCDSVYKVVNLTVRARPSLGADKLVSICRGNSINLASQYSTTGLSTGWTIGTVTVTNTLVSQAGVYQLIAANNFTCTDTALVTVTVNPKPVLGNDTAISICPFFTADLTTLYNTASLTTNWTLNTANVANPAAVSSAGNYRLIATNASGCADTAIVTVTRLTKPALGSDKVVRICPGFTSDLTSLFNLAGLTASWSVTGAAIPNPTAVDSAAVYQLIAANSSGCADTALVTVIINVKPNLGNDTAVVRCDGNVVNLASLYSTAGLTATWTVSGAAVPNAAAVFVAGNYQLIGRNSSGCEDTAVVAVVIRPKPVLGDDTTISTCPGFSINLAALYSTAGLSSSWSVNGMPVPDSSAAFVAGTYRLIVANSFGCADTAIVTLVHYPKPALGIDQAVSVCSGFTANLSALFNTTGLSSRWTLAGQPVPDSSLVAVAGTYRLIATNSSGCSDTAFVQVTINAKPSLGADRVITVCDGIPVDLTAQYNTLNLLPVWTLGGAPVSNTAAITAAGQYQLVASNLSGCADTAVVRINVNPKPFAGTDTIVRICPAGFLNLRNVYNTGILSGVWTIGGANVPNPGAVNVDGIYRLIVSNTFGCTDTAFVTLVTDANPVLVVNTPATVCYPNLVNLSLPAVTAGTTPGVSLSYWSNNSATDTIPDAAAVANGTYYIKATNSTGCIDIKPVTVNILPLIEARAGADISICKGSMGTLLGSVANASGSVTYSWTPDIGLGVSSAAVTTVTPDTTRVYVLNVRDNYGCNFSVFDSVLVTVPPPVPAFAGNDTIASTGAPHQLTATGGVSYEWSPAGLLNNAFIANPIATIFDDSVQFIVIVKDQAGCIGTSIVTVRTLDGITYYVPNAFSPDGNGINDVFRPIPVGVVSTEFFRIFNRFGETVFATSQMMKGWDGTYKGKPQPPANYVWVLKGRGRNGKVIEMKGNVVLVR